MDPELRVSGVVEESIVDGPGLRYVVFTQGCPHHCPGCHNPESHDPGGGRVADPEDLYAAFQQNPLLSGMTFSGGEPFMQAGALLPLAKRVAASGRTLAVFTGYTCERLAEMAQSDSAVQALLELVDLLVDGPYIHELKNLELDYRGSGNQRLLGRDDIRAIMERFSSGTYPMEGNAEVSRTREGVGQPVLPSARV